MQNGLRKILASFGLVLVEPLKRYLKKMLIYVGLYLEAPIFAITHIGIVEHIEPYDGGVDYYLKALIKLEKPIKPGHAIRKHENWKVSDFGLNQTQMDKLRLQLRIF